MKKGTFLPHLTFMTYSVWNKDTTYVHASFKVQLWLFEIQFNQLSYHPMPHITAWLNGNKSNDNRMHILFYEFVEIWYLTFQINANILHLTNKKKLFLSMCHN